MKACAIFLGLIMTCVTASGQASKAVEKIYEESKYKEVVEIAGKIDNYLSKEDEKAICDLAGRSYYIMGQYDSGIYYENRALAIDNDATWVSAWAYVYRGKSFYRQGKTEAGIADLKKAISLSKTRNSVQEAEEFLANINNNCVPEGRYAYYFSQNEYKNAIEDGRKQLEKHQYKEVLEVLGGCYYYLDEFDSAIYFERKAIAVDNDATSVSGWAHTFLGMSLFEKNEKEDGISELKKTITLDKNAASVRRAEGFLDAIINGRRFPVDSAHQVIKRYLMASNYRAAANTGLSYVAANPRDAVAWDQLCSAYNGLHYYDSSLLCGQKAIELDNNETTLSCEVHFFSGIARFMKGDRVAADAEFKNAINSHSGEYVIKRVKQARNLMGMNDTYDHWKTEERDNIVFHFQNRKSIDNVDELMNRYVDEYNNTVKILPSHLPKKIDLFVWEKYALGEKQEDTFTEADYCLAHVSQTNRNTSEILKILGHWQQK